MEAYLAALSTLLIQGNSTKPVEIPEKQLHKSQRLRCVFATPLRLHWQDHRPDCIRLVSQVTLLAQRVVAAAKQLQVVL